MRRWLVGLPVSFALHGALVVAAIAFLRVEPTPPPLLIDLNAIIAGREDGSDKSDGMPGKSLAASRPLRQATPPRESPAPPTPAVEPASPPREPLPTVNRDVIVPSPASVPSSTAAATTTETVESGSAPAGATPRSDAVAGSSGSATRGGGTDPGATGSGGGGANRVAALGVEGGTGVGSEYRAYYERLRQRIQEVLRYPPAARRRELAGTVHIEIAIEPNGAIGSVSVIGSSSHELLDRAAVAAAKSVPRVPFPSDVRPRALRVRLPVIFELK